MIIVFALINGPIQGIASRIESSFFIIFYIDKMTTLKYWLKVCFSVSIKIDPCLGLSLQINMSLFGNVPEWIKEFPDHLKTQEMCDKTVCMGPYSLVFVPDCFKTERTCNEEVRREPGALDCVPDHLKHEDVQWCSAHRTTLLNICPWSSQNARDVFRGSVEQAMHTVICTRSS